MNPDILLSTINKHYLSDQQMLLQHLLARMHDYDAGLIKKTAHNWIQAVRNDHSHQNISAAFLHEYQLSSHEGIILMSIAEALLRIPDTNTQDLFLKEKLSSADWYKHELHSDSVLVNLSTGALFMTGKFEHYAEAENEGWQSGFESLLSRLGAPVIRRALIQAMQFLANQFVIAETIETALQISHKQTESRFSFDMLGEAACTEEDAERYFESYQHAIATIAKHSKHQNIFQNPGISIKLSALYPRYEAQQHQAAVPALTRQLLKLAKYAQAAHINLTIDAEESARLHMSLQIFSAIYQHPDLKNWQGLGLAVQAYQKRALSVISYLASLSQQQGKQIPIRLVKGAYWDSEIKQAQIDGLKDFPVFTHKTATDLSYLACAKTILQHGRLFYPQFASHNAHTIAAIIKLAENHPEFELQRLHGMGDRLYQEVLQQHDLPCRIYAPVGLYRDLLPYLVRRLLENGANTSFINQLEDTQININQLLNDPVESLRNKPTASTQNIPLPADIFKPARLNSAGLNLNDINCLNNIEQDLSVLQALQWQASPVINAEQPTGLSHQVFNPFNSQLRVGKIQIANTEQIKNSIDVAHAAFSQWRLSSVQTRSACLLKTAELLQAHHMELISLIIREGGRCIPDALSEIREAIDFCRYYAHKAEQLFDQAQILPGPAGEENKYRFYGRGIFVCISPWNFPVAIFIGQISAALAAGNCVIAKPATATTLTAKRCIDLFYQAGFSTDSLQFLPAQGDDISSYLLSDERISGVAFTGSAQTARTINHCLTQHQQIKTLIAETGGQNVLIADSSALVEQLVQDVIMSAFNSAGQRCSALRVLFVQQDIAGVVIKQLMGAMQTLLLGDPGKYSTDIGPVINQQAVEQLQQHVQNMRTVGNILYQSSLDNSLQHASFFPPTLIEIAAIEQLAEEVFGPVLHIIRYKAETLPNVVAEINNSAYGLTLGIHSRIEANIQFIQQHARVGNVYVNRNMIGAVVGSQPFGGMGLSGTGPKAGGPNYLLRFAVEQTISTNTAAIGGNVQLMAEDLR